jgi:2-dehydro-3-deoxy-D-arabinonate dehydratase
MMRIDLIATTDRLLLDRGGELRVAPPGASLDELFISDVPSDLAAAWFTSGSAAAPPDDEVVVAPIGSQEVWAAGVTYLRSRVARAVESKDAGGDAFYDLVYEAERPELFFKATAHRVVGHGGVVRIRRDSTWNVPEPELTLAVNRAGHVFGYTIGNDMSSRSIEGANPLYLPQAKVYAQCAALGPRLVIDGLPAPHTAIRLAINRHGATVFSGATELARIKRDLVELAGWLYRENEFPAGAYLMTGTGIVPGDDFTLDLGDEIRIEIDGVGVLVNVVG